MTLSQNGRPSPLDELYEYAKNKGTITYQEVTDRLGNTFFEADQLEKVLDKLESLGVTVVDSAEIPDASPAAMEVPDPALNDDLSEADVISADDPVRMYLKEIGKVPLLSAEEEIEYAEARKIPLKINRETNYSKDKNLWHLSHEGLDLEDPANEPKYDEILEMGVSPEKAPDVPTYITLTFEKGEAVALNGEKLEPVEMLAKLNEIGGANGVGIADMVENRLVGMKSRGVYETPGGTILYAAHQNLEEITVDKETQHFKQQVSLKLADNIYNGQWYTPLTEALLAFVDKTQENVNGDVKLKLYKGNIVGAGVTSPDTLHDLQTASFDEDDDYDQYDAKGFITLYGLPIKVKAKLDQKKKK